MKLKLLVIFLLIKAIALAQKPLPAVKNENGKFTYYVDGTPYIVLGAQLWNSTAWPYLTDQYWQQAKQLNANTIEAPIYWQNIEPEQGKFNFKELDHLINSARNNGFKLILLWFGTYKNGRSQYAPSWVLENPAKYPRMKNAAEEEIYVLSAVSKTNLEADKKAFMEVMRHIKEIDAKNQTVIMMQVENEPGSMWTNRDYSEEANRLYQSTIPEELSQGLKKSVGKWEEVFNIDGPEAFNAYYIAKYIDEIAAAGKSIYNLPMYTNVWIRENEFERPGEYPSGGPTSNMIDIWKITAPNLFTLALDVYHGNPLVVDDLFKKYTRPDNPLFVPEMGNGENFARFQFYAIGNYNAVGVAPYGIDPNQIDNPNDLRDKEKLDARFSGIALNYKLISKSMIPLTQLQGTGKLTAIGEEEGMSEKLVRLQNYDLLFHFGYPSFKDRSKRTGRALIGQLNDDEFLLIGCDVKFQFRPGYGSGFNTAEFVLVEEGFYEGEKWVRSRIWNGDILYHSILPQEGAILKIKLRRVKASGQGEVKANFDK
jgi:hypothetical protein